MEWIKAEHKTVDITALETEVGNIIEELNTMQLHQFKGKLDTLENALMALQIAKSELGKF